MNEKEIKITPLQIANAINNVFLEKDDLFVKLERSKKEIEKLNNRIDKAIDYIEKFIPIDNDTILMRERQRDYLLYILKGSDSNG